MNADSILSHQDFPVSSIYIHQILSKTESQKYIESKWLNAISILLTAGEAQEISKFSFVSSIQPVMTFQKTTPSNTQPAQPNLKQSSYLSQLQQLKVDQVHQLGITGKNVKILVIDSGFRRTHTALSKINVIDTYDFIHGIPDVDNQPSDHPQQYFHGTRCLSLIGGFQNLTYSGVAPGASFLLAKTENLNVEDPVEEDYFVQAVEWGEKKGADMISTSLGYSQWYQHSDFDGKTAVTTKIINYAELKGIVAVVANGNYGNDGIDAPADAFYSLSVGAVDSNGAIASFSSRGPTADGRIKPEVCALGVSALTADVIDLNAYTVASGTSFSTPLVAGVVALILEKHPEWNPGDVYHAITSTASRSSSPDNSYGYGIVNAWDAIHYNITRDYGCHKNCSGNGACFEDKCVCYSNFYGLSCQNRKSDCEASCNNGNCNENNVCVCNLGWMGRTCGISESAVLGATAIAFIVLATLCLVIGCCCCVWSGGCAVEWWRRKLKFRNPRLNLQIEDHSEPMFQYGDLKEELTDDLEVQHETSDPNNVVYSNYAGTFELGDLEGNELEFDEKPRKKSN